MLKLLVHLVLALNLVASEGGVSRHENVEYVQLGQKGNVAAHLGNSVLYNGNGRIRVRTLEECKDACTVTDQCLSFYYCTGHHRHFNTCWLMVRTLYGNELTRRNSVCTSYYARVPTGLPTSAPSPAFMKTCENGAKYTYTNDFTEVKLCGNGKRFIYTDRYENKTSCINSATTETDYCWWDTTMQSNCLESSECVWLTEKIDQGLCYCSVSTTDCEACYRQTPAPTVNTATSLCPNNCKKYYLGCVGMYCDCLRGCTSPEEAGCSAPVNAGCYIYYTNSSSPSPTNSPTVNPTVAPTVLPTDSPTNYPTFFPSALPTISPTESPAALPTLSPTPQVPQGIGARDDLGYCTQSRKCSVGQGDCDSNSDCAPGLICGRDNCQKFNSKALSWTDCCIRKLSLTSRSKTGWVNKWGRVLDWSAGSNRMITGFFSEHSKHRKDRRWAVYTAAAKGVTCKPQGLSRYVNGWDHPLTFVCPDNQALYGVYSVYNKHRRDRRWSFNCCEVSSNAYLKRGYWTNYRNNWKKGLNFRCLPTQVLVGLGSYHNNHHEDRRWKFYCADLINFN